MKSTSEQRLKNVNEFMRIIGGCGRKFFADRGAGHFSYLELDTRGRVWFVDDYTGKRVYTHYSYRWSGFSHGGTIKDLVCTFRDHIKKGVQIHPRYFKPSRYIGGRHHWGYPEADLEVLHSEGQRLGIVAVELSEASNG